MTASHEGHVGKDVRASFSHLRREVRTALELAVVALAPTELIDRLATAAGLLEALTELPTDGAPVAALVPRVFACASGGLDDWQTWRKEHYERRLARV